MYVHQAYCYIMLVNCIITRYKPTCVHARRHVLCVHTHAGMSSRPEPKSRLKSLGVITVSPSDDESVARLVASIERFLQRTSSFYAPSAPRRPTLQCLGGRQVMHIFYLFKQRVQLTAVHRAMWTPL